MSDDIIFHIPALRAYARVLCRSSVESDDLVQETLLRAIRSVHRYQLGTNMRAWLFTIMRNRYLTDCHKAARERTGSSDCVSTLPKVNGNQEFALQTKRLQAALQQMPAHYRDAIVLVGVWGETYADAAHALDCDIGTIKSRVNRARHMLRDVLGPI